MGTVHSMDRYLGDGLYARVNTGMIELYASDGITTTNRVYLEPTVLAAFLGWLHDNKLAKI